MELSRTHVVARPNPTTPSRHFVAVRGSDILEPAPGRQTYREALAGT